MRWFRNQWCRPVYLSNIDVLSKSWNVQGVLSEDGIVADNQTEERVQLTVLGDSQTPYEFVVSLLQEVFGQTPQQAMLTASTAHHYGEADCGVWPHAVAVALLDAAQKKIEQSDHPLAFARSGQHGRYVAGQDACAFCGKPEAHVALLYRKSQGCICNECLMVGTRQLSDRVSDSSFHFAHEVLAWHFETIGQSDLETSVRSFPMRMRADLQLALDHVLADSTVRQLGIKSGYRYDTVEFADLWETGRSAKSIAPVQYVDIDIGEVTPRRCVGTAFWLLDVDGLKHAILVSQEEGMRGAAHVRVEIAAPSGQAGAEIAADYFLKMAKIIDQAQSYRGKVLSLDVQDRWQGLAGGVTIHQLPKITREDVILPKKTLDLLHRNVLDFATYRDRLKALGQPAKKGLLFYGPPGTGKTHTIQYLAGNLDGHTTFLVSAEQVTLLHEYVSLARLLQPAIIVLEDADLIARDREEMGSAGEEALLNKLLNEMDGLQEDADIFFILTTNRPHHLETALAGRPGRIDQAIEFPLPDADGRTRLAALYGGGVRIDDDIMKKIVARTDGVSAAFVKELMRRISQHMIELDAEDQPVTEQSMTAAIDEIMFEGGTLNFRLLGGVSDADQKE